MLFRNLQTSQCIEITLSHKKCTDRVHLSRAERKEWVLNNGTMVVAEELDKSLKFRVILYFCFHFVKWRFFLKCGESSVTFVLKYNIFCLQPSFLSASHIRLFFYVSFISSSIVCGLPDIHPLVPDVLKRRLSIVNFRGFVLLQNKRKETFTNGLFLHLDNWCRFIVLAHAELVILLKDRLCGRL